MPDVTRITDETVGTCNPGLDCCPHGRNGVNTEGSPDVEADDIPVHRLTDGGSCRCPHDGSYESVEGDEFVEVNDLPITLVGHTTRCVACGVTGAHSTGSPDVEVGG